MDRDENSAHNILDRFLARLGPHVADATRCADVFTAIDKVNTLEHIEKGSYILIVKMSFYSMELRSA